MNKLLIAAAALLLAACASSSNTASTSDPAENKVYRTGSNLPVRDPEPSATTKTMDPSTIRTQPAPGLNPRVGG